MLHLKKIWKSHSRIKEIILLFLLGFFFGGILYFLFQQSFRQELLQFETGLSLWGAKDSAFLGDFLYALYGHGKMLLLFWVLTLTPICFLYVKVFLVCHGFRYGFMLSFFVSSGGISGMLKFLQTIFPHGILFAAMYLFLFGKLFHGKIKEKQVTFIVFSAILLLLGCFLESYINIPLMQSVYK